jgi:hypothetical protein
LERGSDTAFQKTDYEFAKKYEKAVLEKNIDTKKGEPFRISNEDKDYLESLSNNSRITAFLKAKENFRKRNRRRDDSDQPNVSREESFIYKEKEFEQEKNIRKQVG